MGQTAITFHAGDVSLEGVVGSPDGATGPVPGVVICHPHPLAGGNMNNNLVLAVYQALLDGGFAALRFNFRGVGNSRGSHTRGEREPEDAEAALNALEERADVDGGRLAMMGYSFGSRVLLKNLARYRGVRAFALLSSPLDSLEGPDVAGDGRPKLFVCGDRDRGVASDSFREKVESFGGASEVVLVPGADHFWVGRETEAARHTVRFFQGQLRA